MQSSIQNIQKLIELNFPVPIVIVQPHDVPHLLPGFGQAQGDERILQVVDHDVVVVLVGLERVKVCLERLAVLLVLVDHLLGRVFHVPLSGFVHVL